MSSTPPSASPDSATGLVKVAPRSATIGLVITVLFACCWQLLPAATIPFDIVYVRVPRAGDDRHVKWADVFGPMNLEAGSDLVLLHADGREEALVSAGRGAVADPCVSFDARWVFYSYIPNVDAISPVSNTPSASADIYKSNIASREVVRLTNREFTRRVVTTELLLEGGPFRDVVAGPDGYLYLATDGSRDHTNVGNGQILRLVPSSQ